MRGRFTPSERPLAHLHTRTTFRSALKASRTNADAIALALEGNHSSDARLNAYGRVQRLIGGVMLGRYSPDPFEYANGRPAAHTLMLVRKRDTLIDAALFDDLAGTEPISNPTRTDALGNLTFVSEVGDYDLYPEFGGRIEFSIGEPGLQGPPGPMGPQGPPGNPDSLSQTITVASASTVWEGELALEFTPAAVIVRDQAGKMRFGFDVQVLTATHYRIEFGRPMIGTFTVS